MAQDIGDKLKSILSDPQMMDTLSNLLNSGASDELNENEANDIKTNAASLMSRLGGGDDKRINLLNALKPYMKNTRSDSIDKAVRIIKLTKLGSVLKDL